MYEYEEALKIASEEATRALAIALSDEDMPPEDAKLFFDCAYEDAMRDLWMWVRP